MRLTGNLNLPTVEYIVIVDYIIVFCGCIEVGDGTVESSSSSLSGMKISHFFQHTISSLHDTVPYMFNLLGVDCKIFHPISLRKLKCRNDRSTILRNDITAYRKMEMDKSRRLSATWFAQLLFSQEQFKYDRT